MTPIGTSDHTLRRASKGRSGTNATLTRSPCLAGMVCALVLGSISTVGISAAPQSKSLFDGRSLTNWEIVNNGQFQVQDGVIRVNRGTGWLRSVETFADFTLVMEFRFLETEANSGIFVRTGPTSNDDANGWPDNGYQIQCMDTVSGNHPLATMIPYGAPPFDSQSDLEALKNVYKPVGEWQTYQITCRGETMEVRLNGRLITTCTSIKNRSGHIGIQGEKGLLEFRKIEMTPIATGS